jgi:hypothetical protein
MSLSITGLENDYLRNELKELKIKIKESDKILVSMIHEWIMSNEGFGIGEDAEARNCAEELVSRFKSERSKLK